MTDPAVEAAQRAWDAITHDAMMSPRAVTESAAREALEPIRDLHRPFMRNYPGEASRIVCNHCLGPRDWPCTTARYAYTAEELER